MNIGPKGDGAVPENLTERLREIGQWMKVNGESIYGAEKSEIGGGTAGLCSRVGDKHFLQILRWVGSEIIITNVKKKLNSAVMLQNGKSLDIQELGNGRWLISGLPESPPDPYCTVIKL